MIICNITTKKNSKNKDMKCTKKIKKQIQLCEFFVALCL